MRELFHLMSGLFLLFGLVGCNVWDNIYSQTYANSPILIQQSISLNFKIKEYSLDGNFDFNSDLQLMTVTTYFDMLMIKMQILKVQLDMKTLILSAVQAGKNGCQRFKLAALSAGEYGVAQVSKDRLFLLNVLFKFVGTDQNHGKKLDKYKFQPFLFSSPEQQLEKIKVEIEKNMEDQGKDEIDDVDVNLDFLLYVSVDSVTGRVERITEGKAEQVVPFQLSSSVKRPIACTEEVKVLTNDDLKELFGVIVKNRGSYDKLFDGNSLPFP